MRYATPPSALEFHRMHVAKNAPCVISGLAKGWTEVRIAHCSFRACARALIHCFAAPRFCPRSNRSMRFSLAPSAATTGRAFCALACERERAQTNACSVVVNASPNGRGDAVAHSPEFGKVFVKPMGSLPPPRRARLLAVRRSCAQSARCAWLNLTRF